MGRESLFGGRGRWETVVDVIEYVAVEEKVVMVNGMEIILAMTEEEELGRPVSLGEVFMKSHTKADGTFVDQKARQVAETYEKNLEEILFQMDVDGPENSTETSTHRTSSVKQKNEIFLRCTKTDDKQSFWTWTARRDAEEREKKGEMYELFFLIPFGDARATSRLSSKA
ncbi:putative transposase Ptta/En/Spm plant [Arabidopsis suecica]|uniref:Putative transposase Ptta/En/Spm plant n=1 Tax=Arabidopsis suecica TaxID=45249 RepID=A0A8T1ZFT7_ARASU|nr:putative transposase Ptta/En/Spm plant [Arabidopsis suecica]